MYKTFLMSLAIIQWSCLCSTDEDRLLADLLIGYNKMSRPVFKPYQPVRVKLAVSLREAIDLNEDLGQVKILIWLKMIWKDFHLNWNPEQYGRINRVFIPPDAIWTPDITLYNAIHSEPDGDRNHLKLSVLYNGEATWIRPVTYSVTCKHQFRGNAWLCPFTFGSWVYTSDQLEIHGEKRKVQINDEQFLSSDHFILLGHEGKREPYGFSDAVSFIILFCHWFIRHVVIIAILSRPTRIGAFDPCFLHSCSESSEEVHLEQGFCRSSLE
ncbi:hypothetical protein LSH36_15g20031 [Paralvinella palmiformis]|uniref:Neurotransmitter-gated ion-channel ligand-binding domain-containing protein n=1 Tax=Paralvinella palmiformis TaxID=53620 RepID=A0AAD9KDY0_9ANNE|nr:hypothetical protein LSH36_15g20031 [Paralvinella palmiformis]